VDSTVLAQLKQVGFYRENPVEKWQAFILQLGKFDENDIGASFDSVRDSMQNLFRDL
jgi:hypothetical protein